MMADQEASEVLTGAGVESALAAQGIALVAGRGERLARGLNILMAASRRDCRDLEFDTDPPSYLTAVQECKAGR